MPMGKPHPDLSGHKRTGKASFYAKKFAGREMADGTPMDPNADNAASKTLPLGTTAKVTNVETGQSATVTIQDRGPYVKGRIIDLSPATALEIGLSRNDGIATVVVAPIEVPLYRRRHTRHHSRNCPDRLLGASNLTGFGDPLRPDHSKHSLETKMTSTTLELERNRTANPPLSPGPLGAHPIGTGLGVAAGSVAAGALAGTVAGPSGAVIGARTFRADPTSLAVKSSASIVPPMATASMPTHGAKVARSNRLNPS